MSASTVPSPDYPQVTIIRSTRRKKSVQARHEGDQIIVRVPASLTAAEERAAVATIVAKLQARTSASGRSDAELLRRAHRLNAEVLDGRARFRSVRWVGNQHTRWGSCSPGSGAIRLSDRLQHTPDYVVDAVLVHELVHTFIPDHSVEFYRWANRAPGAERARGYLEAYQRWGRPAR